MFGLVAGGASVLQGVLNGALAEASKSTLSACLINFTIGAVGLYIACLFGGGIPLSGGVVAPWWAWVGGLIGAALVVTITALIPQIGAANTFALVIAGQTIVALIFDHYGILGVPQRTASLTRIGGVLLLIVGVICARR